MSITTSSRRCSSTSRSSISGSMRGRPSCSGRMRGAAMLRRIAELGSLVALGCVAQAAFAENFDYDSRRPAQLRACDDPRDHGKAAEAKSCYQKLLNSSKDPAVQAEASWALGDVRHANELFKAAVQANDKAVRTR